MIKETQTLTLHEQDFVIAMSQSPELWRYCALGDFERDTFTVLDKYLENESVMLDLGAWEGPFTLYSARKCKKVIAVEPDPVAYNMLNKQIALNDSLLDRISTFQLAIAANNGSVSLFQRNAFGDSSSTLLERARDTGDNVMVKTRTLETFFKESEIDHVDLIKIDIEGSEFIILKNAPSILQAVGKPTLVVAFHVNYLKESMLKEVTQNRVLVKLLMKVKKYILNRRVKKVLDEILGELSVYQYLVKNGKEVSGNSLDMSEDFQLVFSGVKK